MGRNMKRVSGPVSAVVAAAAIAAAITILPAGSEKVVASTPAVRADGYRDTQSFGTVCAEQAWPYIAADCVNDRRMATGKAKAARVVAIDRLVARCPVIPCDESTARHYARLRNRLRGKGRPIPENDLWIAATASEHGLVLVTRDDHFDQVEGLSVERW